MVAVTEKAKEELKKILTANNTDAPDACLRLSHDEQGQLRLALDEKKQDDETVEHQGATLLLVEEKLSDLLQGIVIDAEETPEGVKLIISQEY